MHTSYREAQQIDWLVTPVNIQLPNHCAHYGCFIMRSPDDTNYHTFIMYFMP